MSGENYLAQLDAQYGLPAGWLEGIQNGESSGGANLGSTGAFQLTQGWINQYAPGTPYGAYPVGSPQWAQQANAVGNYFGNQGGTLQGYTGLASAPNAAYADLTQLASWSGPVSGGGGSGNGTDPFAGAFPQGTGSFYVPGTSQILDYGGGPDNPASSQMTGGGPLGVGIPGMSGISGGSGTSGFFQAIGNWLQNAFFRGIVVIVGILLVAGAIFMMAGHEWHKGARA